MRHQAADARKARVWVATHGLAARHYRICGSDAQLEAAPSLCLRAEKKVTEK